MSRADNRKSCPLMAEAIDQVRALFPDSKSIRVRYVSENGVVLGEKPELPADQFEISAESYLDSCERNKQRAKR